MKIVGISCVKNEEDIVEAFVRHNLTYCDDLLILNHGSTDATLEILHSLQNEGFRVHVVTDCTLGNLQTVHTARLLQMAIHDHGADWIACLDADEFIQGPLRDILERDFAADEKQFCCRIRLVNYRAQPQDDYSLLNPVDRLTWHDACDLKSSTVYSSKLFIPVGLARQEGAFVERGSHQFSINGTVVSSKFMDELALAHYPFRRPAQLGSKLTARILQKFCARGAKSSNSDHYEDLYRKMRRSYSAFSQDFYQFRPIWVSSSKTMSDMERRPAEYRGGTLRYTSAQNDVDQLIRNILDLGETLATASSSSGTLASSSPTVSLSLCNEQGIQHLNGRTYSVNPVNFSAMSLSLKGLASSGRIHIGISAEAGILEINEITVKFEDDAVQIYTGRQLPRLLLVNENGLKVYNSAMVKFLVASGPLVITLQEDGLFSGRVPTELILSIRHIVDNQRMSMAVFDLTTIRQLHGTTGADEDYRSRYSIGSELYFDRFGEGHRFLGTRWGRINDWGTWSEGAQPMLFLRLDRPTAAMLRMEVLIRRHKGSALKLSISLDKHPLGAWELENRQYQWLSVTIPANPHGRSMLDFTFHLETAEGSLSEGVAFGIKQLRIEEIGWKQSLFNRCCRSWSLVVAGFLGVFGANRIIPGREIDFCQEGRGIWLLGQGWGQPSPTGCKMLYDRADLKGRLAWPRTGRLNLRIRARVDQQILDREGGRLPVVIGEQRLFLQQVSSETSAWFEVAIPKSAFQDGVLHLKLWKQQGDLEIEKLALEPGTESIDGAARSKK